MKLGDNELAFNDARAARTVDPSYAKVCRWLAFNAMLIH